MELEQHATACIREPERGWIAHGDRGEARRRPFGERVSRRAAVDGLHAAAAIDLAGIVRGKHADGDARRDIDVVEAVARETEWSVDRVVAGRRAVARGGCGTVAQDGRDRRACDATDALVVRVGDEQVAVGTLRDRMWIVEKRGGDRKST